MNNTSKLKEGQLSAETARDLWDYNPNTGELRWKIQRGCVTEGDLAGVIDSSNGYRKIGYANKDYMSHRIIWLLQYGRWPNEIDHINGQRDDNRASNLREVDRTTNNRNASLSTHNSSGVIGVRWHKLLQKWHARITINYKEVNLGYFHKKQDAIQARKQAERKYNFHPNHGRSATV